MIKTRTWVIGLSVGLVVCTALSLYFFTRKTDGTVANIYQNGVCVYSVDLSAVSEPYELTFTDAAGENKVLIQQGRICVIEADCADRICVNQGWLSDSASPIVCLPHRLVIRIETDAEAADEAPDAVAR
jgi:hypothetical protein